MNQVGLRNLREGESFEGILWLVSGAVRKTKNGDPYWEGTFQDATGSMPGKLWDSAGGKGGRVGAAEPVLKPGGPIRLRARVDAFQGSMQLNLQAVWPVEPGFVDPSLFAPRSRRTTDEMTAEFEALIESMQDADYRALLERLLADQEVFPLLCAGPAAKAIHHPWIGGLLEHSLSLARGVRALASNYPELNVDLLLCGCFLHDIGKIYEISSDPGFEYTTDGKLLGHIYMGARLTERLCDGCPGFPEEKRRHLVHLVLSHQGDRNLGFGSAADPSTPEAIFFHHLDNLDAKLQHCLTALEGAEEAGAAGEFTSPWNGPIRKGYYRIRPDGGDGSEGRNTEPEGPQPQAEEEERSGDEEERTPQPRLW